MLGGKTLDQLLDIELIAQASAGDINAFEELVRRYQDQLFRTAYFMLGDAAEAEDAVQVSLLKAWQSLARFDPKRASTPETSGLFRPWIITIVSNETRNRLRHRKRHPALNLESMPFAYHRDPLPLPAQQISTREDAELLIDVLNRLSADDRQIIALRYFVDLSESEMAELLQVPKGTVKSRLSRAMARARQEFAASGRISYE